jgi:hypothetical protein
VKLAATKQDLALRLIEKGDTLEGRRLLQESSQVLGSSRRATLGLIMSYLPVSVRQLALQGFRQIRPKDYADQVREAAS